MNFNEKRTISYAPIGEVEDDSSGAIATFKRKLSSSLPQNLNLYWLSVTGLAAWFFLIHTPPYLLQAHKWKDVLVWFHLVGVGGIYLACIFNTLVTPSWNKPLHVWVGRVGLVLGVWGFGWGAWLSWGRPGVDLSFSIPITIGGIMQLGCEAVGYDAICRFKAVRAQIESLPLQASPDVVATLKEKQKRHLMIHIGCMLGLFVMACSIPAIMRLTETSGLPLLLTAIAGLYVINYFYSETFFRRIRNKSSSIVNSEAATESSRLVH